MNGDENVSSTEVEIALASQPAVLQVAVIVLKRGLRAPAGADRERTIN